jgi:site-specific recombinase XerD
MSSNRATHGLVPMLAAAGCKPLARGWHALRHTFASQFIMAGGNLATLQKLLGHATIEMTLVYSHLAPDFVAGELERLKY